MMEVAVQQHHLVAPDLTTSGIPGGVTGRFRLGWGGQPEWPARVPQPV